jgi:hypothetical protein
VRVAYGFKSTAAPTTFSLYADYLILGLDFGVVLLTLASQARF